MLLLKLHAFSINGNERVCHSLLLAPSYDGIRFLVKLQGFHINGSERVRDGVCERLCF